MTGSAKERLRWLAVVCVWAAGLFYVYPFERARGARAVDRDAAAVRALQRDETAIRDLPLLEAERRRLGRTLEPAPSDLTAPALVAAFLHTAGRVTANHRVRIASIGGDAVPAPRTTPLPPASRVTVATLELTLEGRYRDLLDAVSALPLAGMLTTVDLVSIARKDGSPSDTLTASVHAVLSRPTAGHENADARQT